MNTFEKSVHVSNNDLYFFFLVNKLYHFFYYQRHNHECKIYLIWESSSETEMNAWHNICTRPTHECLWSFCIYSHKRSIQLELEDAKHISGAMILCTSARICESGSSVKSSATWKNGRVSVQWGKNGGKTMLNLVKRSIERPHKPEAAKLNSYRGLTSQLKHWPITWRAGLRGAHTNLELHLSVAIIAISREYAAIRAHNIKEHLGTDTTWHAYVRRQRETMPGQATAGVWGRFPLTVVLCVRVEFPPTHNPSLWRKTEEKLDTEAVRIRQRNAKTVNDGWWKTYRALQKLFIILVLFFTFWQ